MCKDSRERAEEGGAAGMMADCAEEASAIMDVYRDGRVLAVEVRMKHYGE